MDITDFKNIHWQDRAFIACNGPSLNDIPMELLENEYVFGLNRGYLKENLPITYLVNIEKTVAHQWGEEMLAVPCAAFFTNHVKGDHVVGLKFGGVGKIFQTDLTEPAYRGNTVTYVAMQLTFYMGFHEVYCIGLDHSFSYSNTKRDKSHRRRVINVGDDPNHFHPDYFGDGTKWLPYEPHAVESAYSLALTTYQKYGRILMNASTRTELSEKILPRIEFKEIFK